MVKWYFIVALLIFVFVASAYIVLQVKKRSAQEEKASVEIDDLGKKKNFMDIIDEMEGREFEYFCAELLKEYGYTSVHVTSASGDQGVDIVANKDNTRCAFQCKRYSSKLGNEAVQQVNAGRQIYSCFRAVVITNSYFTRGATQAARATKVELWDRDILQDKIYRLIKRDIAFKKMVADAKKSLENEKEDAWE